MLGVYRSNSLPLPSSSSSTVSFVQSLDGGVEFMDRYGALRRSSTVTRRMILRGTSVGDLEYIRTTHDQEDDPETNNDETLEGKLALERMRYAKMLRRKKLIMELRESKRQLLLKQHEEIFERVQLWHDASELDPAVELTKENNILSPSSKANSFIDVDGNVRRRKSRSGPSTEVLSSDTPPATGLAAVTGAAVAIAPRKSQVLEFLQLFLED